MFVDFLSIYIIINSEVIYYFLLILDMLILYKYYHLDISSSFLIVYAWVCKFSKMMLGSFILFIDSGIIYYRCFKLGWDLIDFLPASLIFWFFSCLSCFSHLVWTIPIILFRNYRGLSSLCFPFTINMYLLSPLNAW